MSEPVDVQPPPPRKRRRPALSCEQCRRRKIKCDRNYPCGQCLQSKTVECTYSPGSHPAGVGHVNPGFLDKTHDGATIPSRTKVPSVHSFTHQSSNHSSSPNATHLSDGTETTWPSPTGGSPHDEPQSNKALLNRILNLEKRLAQSTEQNLQSSSTRLPRKEVYGTLEQKGNLRGTVSKTRFFGQSHWMYSFGTFDKIACINIDPSNNTPELSADVRNSDVYELLEKCKSMARAAKAKPHNQYLMNPNFRESVPPRDISDKLINLYFRTSESIYRILHIPSFWREYNQYWESPPSASSSFVLKMLLAMSIGAVFYQEPGSEHWREQAIQWIFAGQAWLASPFEKGRLHISGLQIHCLVLIARLDNAIAGDLVWISAGSLLRTAFQMGFHRDPAYLPRMSPMHAELRRRLWATVLELNVQSSLDSGMPPLVSVDDFDTNAPSNIDDADIEEGTASIPQSKSSDTFTQTSLQIRLFNSIGLRLAIVAHANSFRYEPSYEEVLRISSELTTFIKDNNTFINKINRSPANGVKVSHLQRNLLDLSLRRFVLTLHRPYAARALKDPRYYFSRKICLDSSTTMLSYPSSDPSSPPLEPGYQDDYTRLTIVRGGFIKGLIVHAAMVIFTELLTLLDEDTSFTDQGRAAREPLKQLLRHVIDLAAKRIEIAENNIKGHLFIAVVLAQVEAQESGESCEKKVMEAGRESAQLCLELLSKRIGMSVSEADYLRHIENGISADGIGVISAPDVGSVDFTMEDWNMDFNLPDSWLLGGWEDNQPWGLQI